MISTLVSLTFLQEIARATGGLQPPPPPTPRLGCCITDCHDRPDGDYQSCYGCEYYATCANGQMLSSNPTISFWDRRPCGAPGIGLVWDDNKKECRWTSDTCDPENGVCNEKCESYLPEEIGGECDSICETADYLIILDGSGSISSGSFADSLVWLQGVITDNIPESANVAALQFGAGTAWMHQYSETQSPRATMLANIAGTSYMSSGDTNIANALNVGIPELAAQSAPNKVLILLTDGSSSDDPCTQLTAPNEVALDDINLYIVALDGSDPTSSLDCLDPNDIILEPGFDFSAVTASLIECEAICYDEE